MKKKLILVALVAIGVFGYYLWESQDLFDRYFLPAILETDVADDLKKIIPTSSSGPAVLDSGYIIEKVVDGFDPFPVQIKFIENDMLVLQKNDGKVRLVRNGVLQDKAVTQIDVHNTGNLGLLGIAAINNTVYLYVSQATAEDVNADPTGRLILEDKLDGPVVNRIYKYTWDGNALKDPVLVNEFPAGRGWDHVGGIMTEGLDGIVYTVIGDTQTHNGTLQNRGGNEPDDTSVILRVNYEESIIKPKLSENFLEHYYAMGIRNSYGLTIDPVTGYLWDTENGDRDFDEINLVMPGFNSGWNKIMGPATSSEISELPKFGKFVYSNPEFSWKSPVAPTSIFFPNSKIFNEYNDSLLVGDFNTGSIYKFKLNATRTGFTFDNPELRDLVANPGDSLRDNLFAIGFVAILDIELGPDGYIYILDFQNGGTVYRILPSDGIEQDRPQHCEGPPEPNVNWSGCNFPFEELSGANLENANLANSNLLGINLSESNLVNADLSGSNLVFSNFKNSNLVNVEIISSKLFHADISNSDLRDSNLRNSIFSYANFYQSDLSNANLFGAYFTNGNLESANLSGANMLKALLPGANLEKANLSGTNLSEANLRKVSFSGADLTNADFTGADLTQSDFTGAELTGAIFKEANLKNVVFTDVNLNNVNLKGCLNNPVCEE